MIQFITILSVALLTACDQIIKYFVNLKLNPALPTCNHPDGTFTLIPNVLRLSYCENDGAMMGMMKGKTTVMIIAALLILAVLCFVVFSKKLKPGFLYVCIVGITAGGLGNIIDRIFRGFVIDYIEVLFVDFYVFNFADCLVTCCAFLIMFYEIYELVKESREKKEKQNG